MKVVCTDGVGRPTREHDRKRAKLWRHAAKEVEQFKCEDPRTFNDGARHDVVDAFLELGMQFAQPRTTSGLVEMQRRFKKMRSNLEAKERKARCNDKLTMP